MADLVVRNGTIVDGTGQPAFTGDIAVVDGRIAAVGAEVDATVAPGTPEIDATGLLVTPGWVDIHTHYDGQVTWDEVLAPSAWHGVTTLVMGNCGVGFAPVVADRRDWLIGLMEGVEDIPGTALSEGIAWDWETFPEYLDALEARHWTMDVGTQIAHGAVRAYVMGDRGARNEPATPDDIEQMRSIVSDAIEAGALGFSTSRTIAHTAIDGEPVPGTFAAEDELFGIGAALGDLGTGVFELAPMGAAGEDIVNPIKEVDWMRRLSAKIGRPVTFALIQVDSAPELWRELMDASLAAADEGADIWPQVAARATGLLSGHHTTYSLFDVIPAYQELKARNLSEDELIEALRDPEVRASILGWEPDEATAARLAHAAEHTYLLGDPPDYEPSPDRSLAGLAASSGRDSVRGRLRRDAGRRRSRPALRADPQLLGRQPRRRARDAVAPPGGERPGRRRGALRRDLRRIDPDVHAHPLDARSRAGRDAPARMGGQEADPRHGSALRPERPRHHRARHARRPQRHRLRRPRSSAAHTSWPTSRPGASGWCRARRATSPP